MEAKDYLKSKKIWLGTKVADMNAPENYFELEHLLEDYHQSKLKLLDIPDVVGRSEQLVCKCNTEHTKEEVADNECVLCWQPIKAN